MSCFLNKFRRCAKSKNEEIVSVSLTFALYSNYGWCNKLYIQTSGTRHGEWEQQIVCANEFLVIATFFASLANFAAKTLGAFSSNLFVFGHVLCVRYFLITDLIEQSLFITFLFKLRKTASEKRGILEILSVTIPWG